MKQLGLLIRLIIGIIAGILIGMCGQWFGIADTAFFVTIIRLLATFTSLFSTFLSFMIPLIILSFITVGMAELGKKANRLFGLTLLLAYGTTVISGLLTFFIGKDLDHHITANIVMNAVGIRDSLTEILRAFQF